MADAENPNDVPAEVWLAYERQAKDVMNLWAPDVPALQNAVHAAMIRAWRSGRAVAVDAAVAIKPLEWAVGPRYTGTESAASIFGTWSVWEMGGTGCYKPPEGSGGRSAGSNVADAKAAAQADYEARIRSALALPA